MARSGVRVLPVEEGLRLFDTALSLPEPVYVPIGLDLTLVDGPIYRGLVRTRARRTASAGTSLAARLAGMPEADRADLLLNMVRTHVAAVLGHRDADAVGPDRAFTELGFDSLAALELRNQLNAATGLRLPATLTFDRPHARAIADLLYEQLVGDAGAGGALPEDELRRILLTIPISRLRDAGLMPSLLELGGVRTAAQQQADDPGGSIDDMDADALISMALAEMGDVTTEAGG